MSSPIVGWACSLPDDDRREDIAKVEQQQVGHSMMTKSTLSRSCGTHVFRPRQSASDRTQSAGVIWVLMWAKCRGIMSVLRQPILLQKQ